MRPLRIDCTNKKQGGIPVGIREKMVQPPTLGPVFRGLVVAYLLIFLLSLFCGAIFFLTPCGESWLDPLGVIIIAAALFCGGYSAGHRAGNRGLFHGFSVALVFIILLLIVSVTHGISWSAFLIKSAYSILAAALGGISGVK